MNQELLWALLGAGIGGTGGYGLGKLLRPEDELAAVMMGLGGAGVGGGLGYGSAKAKQQWDAAPDAPPTPEDVARRTAESEAQAKDLGAKALAKLTPEQRESVIRYGYIVDPANADSRTPGRPIANPVKDQLAKIREESK